MACRSFRPLPRLMHRIVWPLSMSPSFATAGTYLTFRQPAGVRIERQVMVHHERRRRLLPPAIVPRDWTLARRAGLDPSTDATAVRARLTVWIRLSRDGIPPSGIVLLPLAGSAA
jgi:hypothetical protein